MQDLLGIKHSTGFVNFKKFWDKNKIEKKLFRHSKELGIYTQIKKAMNPNHKRYRNMVLVDIYADVLGNALRHKGSVVEFKSIGINKDYPIMAAINSSMYLSQLMIFEILKRSEIDGEKFIGLFKKMDKEIFKKRKIKSFLIKRWYYFKLFFS